MDISPFLGQYGGILVGIFVTIWGAERMYSYMKMRNGHGPIGNLEKKIDGHHSIIYSKLDDHTQRLTRVETKQEIAIKDIEEIKKARN